MPYGFFINKLIPLKKKKSRDEDRTRICRSWTKNHSNELSANINVTWPMIKNWAIKILFPASKIEKWMSKGTSIVCQKDRKKTSIVMQTIYHTRWFKSKSCKVGNYKKTIFVIGYKATNLLNFNITPCRGYRSKVRQ